MNTDSNVISLKGIEKSFGENFVLRGVDLSASRGQVISIIGSSGSGKSTLLRCTNLLEIPQAGEIIIDGETVEFKGEGQNREPSSPDQVRAIRARLGMVFQSFNLWAHRTILQNITEAPVHVLGTDPQLAEDRAHDLLAKVGIGDKGNSFPSELSGGQQQRAAIARALAVEPLALLFDEPTSALDPELEVEVLKVIRELASEGRTMLLVTHDMNFAREVSDEVVFLHEGVIEEQGTPNKLFDNPKSQRLQQFINPS